VVVLGDVQLLSGEAVVSLPDLELLPVCSEVGIEVDTVFGVRENVGRETNGGATGLVNPLLKWEKVTSFREAFEATKDASFKEGVS
jgi:hypothetical protein